MTRQEFIKMCGLLGISIPFQSVLASCSSEDENSETDFNGRVLIIGAGAAGLTAGYQLHQMGIEFQILEASSTYGGRMKTTTDFADFPISLGAEWLHVERGIFDEIINNPSTQITVETTPYDPNNDYGLFEGQQVSMADLGFDIDQKFINSSWLDFFTQYIVPPIQNSIVFNEIVASIDYSSEEIIVNTANGQFIADKIIITTPVKLLQNGAISFTPQLPNDKLNAINDVTVWDGFKAFFSFLKNSIPLLLVSILYLKQQDKNYTMMRLMDKIPIDIF